MTQLAAEALCFNRGDKTILRDISLSCAGGTLTGIIGPNGSGKTSLLRVLAALDTPQQGRVMLDNEPLVSLAPKVRARRISYLAQQESLAWPLETETLVMLGRLPHRADFMPPQEADRQAVRKALERCDAGQFCGRATTSLSTGERARILLARALAVEAPVLLADEPIAALDPRHQLAVMATLKAEAARGAAVIVVLHELSLAARFCDRLVLMNDGRIAESGAPDEVLNGEALGQVFGVDFHQAAHKGIQFVIPWQSR